MYTMLAEEPEECSKEEISKTSEESQNNPETVLVAGASEEKKRMKRGKGKIFVAITKYTGTNYKMLLDITA